MKQTIKLVIFLAIVAAISGLLLGYVDSITNPVIQENAIKAEKENLEKMYPGANFSEVKLNNAPSEILGCYEAEGQGYIFKCYAVGFDSSGITILVGMDFDGTITNVICLEQKETNGFGSKVFEDSNIQKLYVGKTLDEEVDMLAGATKTSTAMKAMMDASKEAFKTIK